MTAIVTSLLGGGWPLVAGWILPTALNSLLFALLILPSLRDVAEFHVVIVASHPAQALVLLSVAVVAGLVLSALSTPLYRILEGYSWPGPVRRRWIARQQRARDRLADGLRLARLARQDQLTDDQKTELAKLRGDPRLRAYEHLSSLDISRLAEKTRRYPIDQDQILPTRLGNAIRRFEEYGFDRYRLDVITMWDALYSVVGDQVRRQIDASRASVDFFVCLIYGHIAVAISAVLVLATGSPHASGPLIVIILTCGLSLLWYWLAVSATDEWAAAVRGLVELGRKPLAEALGLDLPATLQEEREMWGLVSRRGRSRYGNHDNELDQFRSPDREVMPVIPVQRAINRRLGPQQKWR